MAQAPKPRPPQIVKTPHTCRACGSTFFPKRSDRTKFCGRECGLAWTGIVHEARSNGCRVTHVVARLRCIKCNGWFSRESGRKVRCGKCAAAKPPSAYKPVKGTVRECAECGAEFVAMGGGKFSSLKFCSRKCRNTDMRKRPGHREAQKAAKARRRARRRGATVHESVSPLRVFQRDGWRCQICRAKTPARLRGTYHDRAPELDHIVALANGGTHEYANVQCLCRACNAKKGATDFGQLHLFAAE